MRCREFYFPVAVVNATATLRTQIGVDPIMKVCPDQALRRVIPETSGDRRGSRRRHHIADTLAPRGVGKPIKVQVLFGVHETLKAFMLDGNVVPSSVRAPQALREIAP
jgi:hypothetical protein